MTQKAKRFYQLRTAYLSEDGDKVLWDVYGRYDTRQEAYEAMRHWRIAYADQQPLRIVQIDTTGHFGDLPDETFIDETGMSHEDWINFEMNGGAY